MQTQHPVAEPCKKKPKGINRKLRDEEMFDEAGHVHAWLC